MHFVYFLQSEKDNGYYIGVSSNPDRRLIEHNSGFSKATRYRKPFKIVRIEKYGTVSEAYRRERWLKGQKSVKIITKIIGDAVPT